MSGGELVALARLVKAKARRVEREAHELRRLAAQLEGAAESLSTDTPDQEDTDVQAAAASPAYA